MFPTTPLIALTATAPPAVEHSILKLLRDPFISKASIDRKNIYLACEELGSCTATTKELTYRHFAERAAEMLENDGFSISDFIDDIGPIMNELNSCGLDSVGYHGEMDIRSRHESYTRWRGGKVKVMVAVNDFTTSWRYVMSHLVHKCRRQTLLELYGESGSSQSTSSPCCDVCEIQSINSIYCTDELEVLHDAINVFGQKGEVKLTMD